MNSNVNKPNGKSAESIEKNTGNNAKVAILQDNAANKNSQGKLEKTVENNFQPHNDQYDFMDDNSILQKKPNTTGLPTALKEGVENLSGHSLDDVKVHYNSAEPGKLIAHAFAQGNQIHIDPGQDKHLANEAWHVVQQQQEVIPEKLKGD